MLGKFGIHEVILVGGVVILLFGAKRLPGLASSIGKSVRALRSSLQDDPGDNATREPRPAE